MIKSAKNTALDLPEFTLEQSGDTLSDRFSMALENEMTGPDFFPVDRIGFAIDCYWEAHRSGNFMAALTHINLAIDDLIGRQLPAVQETDAILNFRDCISHSTTALAFLHGEYLPFLQRRFAACFLTGSMSYARFYGIRGRNDSNPSDLDLFLVFDTGAIALGDLIIPGLVVDADDQQRLERFAENHRDRPTDLINYKLYSPPNALDISLTICSTEGFYNILNFRGGERRRSRLHWMASLGGRKNWLRDLAGRPYSEAYRETISPTGNTLDLAVASSASYRGSRLERISGFAGLLLPRFEFLAITAGCARDLSAFLHQLQDVSHQYRQAGLEASISAAHLRYHRVSAYGRAYMQQRFERLLSQSPDVWSSLN